MLNDVASVSISRTKLDYNVDSSTAEVTVAESRHINCETRTFDSSSFSGFLTQSAPIYIQC